MTHTITFCHFSICVWSLLALNLTFDCLTSEFWVVGLCVWPAAPGGGGRPVGPVGAGQQRPQRGLGPLAEQRENWPQISLPVGQREEHRVLREGESRASDWINLTQSMIEWQKTGESLSWKRILVFFMRHSKVLGFWLVQFINQNATNRNTSSFRLNLASSSSNPGIKDGDTNGGE